MAKTLVLPAAPAGLTLTVRLVDTSDDTIAETITMTEDTNAKGRYTGTITAAAGTYTALIRSGSNVIGTYEEVEVSEDDPSTSVIREKVNINNDGILSLLGSITVTVTSPVSGDGENIELVQGLDYSNTDGRALVFTGDSADQWPDLTGATITLTMRQGSTTISQTATITAPTGTQSFYFEFTDTELSAENAPTGNYRYDIIAVLSSGRKVDLYKEGYARIEAPFSSGEHA